MLTVPMALTAACLLASEADPARDPRPLAEQAYAGLRVRDHRPTGGCIVGWVLPGPLAEKGAASGRLDYNDVILSVGGKKLGRTAFYELVKRSKPGDVLHLKVVRTGGRPELAAPAAAPERKVEQVRLVLASRASWSGPIAFDRPANRPFQPERVLPGLARPTELERFLEPHIRTTGLRAPIDRLFARLRRTQDKWLGFHSLDRVAYAFGRPMHTPELAGAVTRPLARLPQDPRQALLWAARHLDLPDPALGPALAPDAPQAVLARLARQVAVAHGHLDRAFARLGARRSALRASMINLLDGLSRVQYLMDLPDPGARMRTLRDTMAVDYSALLDAAGSLAAVLRPSAGPRGELRAAPAPAALREAVQGDVLAVLEHGGRWFVYGGPGANRYDMRRIDAVIDPGGDDTYSYPKGRRPAVQVVIDLAGDDTYAGADIGPAAAVMGVSLVIDCKGRDRYRAGLCSCGAGVLGVGVLLDARGSDTYMGTAWSLGAGVYGAGLLLDLGPGADTYLARSHSQGIGGARGVGLLLDEQGDDLYRANGPLRSAFNTPAVYCAYSQGMGLGVRLYDSGGIGVLCDLSGDDRYECGEFGQGAGYYFGLGVLHDRAGDDVYYGNRYTQGAGCHQAVGVLIDDAGHDMHYGMTSACQGGAWDESIGVLIDRGGADAYQGQWLSQGGAANQAMAWLVDLGGVDRYVGHKLGSQGKSGPNVYHWDDARAFSWSLLLDAGGDADFYSTGRPNNAVLSPGEPNAHDPGKSRLHGLFIDTDAKL